MSLSNFERFKYLLTMADGQRTQITLLTDQKLDIVVQPKLGVEDLLNIVASHCSLKEPDKQYFALAFLDDSQQYQWLQPDRRVLEHEFPKKFTATGSTLILYHMVKFFVDSVITLTYPSTVELFFLQARANIYRGLSDVDSDTVFELAAYLLQAYCGDFTDDTNAKNALKKLPVLPTFTLKEHPSLQYCEERVVEFYRKFGGLTKGQAILNYMSIVESLPTYGVHMAEVKDKSGIPWWLGIGSKGIFQYDYNDKKKPRKIFHWKQLENLYYRDKKFSVEVYDPRRVTHTLSSVNLYEDVVHQPIDENDELTFAIADPTTQVSVSRRAFGPTNVQVHVFFCATPALCKNLWSMAINQHEFYLDRKSSGFRVATNPTSRLTIELADKLTQSMSSIPSTTSDLGSSVSTQSLQSIQSTNTEKSEEERKRDQETCKALKERKKALELLLVEKLQQLKETCIAEGNITGVLPQEITKALAPGEQRPVVKRRIGTTFSLPLHLVNRESKMDKIGKLELEIEMLRKITAAANRLATDRTINKSVRKKRRQDWQRSNHKLKQLEMTLHQLRISSSKPDLSYKDDPLSKLARSGYSQSAPGTPRVERSARSAPSSPPGSMNDLTSVDSGLNLHEQLVINCANGLAVGANVGSLPNFPRARQPLLSPGVESLCSLNPDAPFELQSMPSTPLLETRRFINIARDNGEGYRSKPPYQSEYRLANYPTVHSNCNSASSSTTSLVSCGRSYSEHSLASGLALTADNDSAERIPEVTRHNSIPGASPMPERKHGGNVFRHGPFQIPLSDTVSKLIKYHNFVGPAKDHDVGLYNIPNQRTSWNYKSIENMTGGVFNGTSLESINGSSGDMTDCYSSQPELKARLNGSTHQRANQHGKPPVVPASRITSRSNSCVSSPPQAVEVQLTPTSSNESTDVTPKKQPAWCSGWNSLDRKNLRNRGRGRTAEYLAAVEASTSRSNCSRTAEIEAMERSPTRYGSPVDLDATLTPPRTPSTPVMRPFPSYSPPSNGLAKSHSQTVLRPQLPPPYTSPPTVVRGKSFKVNVEENNIVMTKPYESADFYKYSSRYRNASNNSCSSGSHSSSNGSSGGGIPSSSSPNLNSNGPLCDAKIFAITSPGNLRRQSPLTKDNSKGHIIATTRQECNFSIAGGDSVDSTFSEEVLAWYDDRDPKSRKTATIV